MLLLLAVSACALRAPPRHGISMSAGTPIRRRQLGTSDLVVSDVCLGTMTWGKQNTLEEGVQQLDCAFDDYGLNFLDTAEMYPCLLYTSPSPRDRTRSRMPSSA